MPEPWNAGGEITVSIALNVDYNKNTIFDELKDEPIAPENVYKEVYKIIHERNSEYIEKLGLKDFDVIINTAAPALYINFENRYVFAEHKSFFDALAESEYVRKIVIS